MIHDEARIHLLSRVARNAFTTAPETHAPSILALCAAAYGARPQEEATVPTGFDPHAVALFESIVEGAYLVARADGVFDDAGEEGVRARRQAACGGAVDAAADRRRSCTISKTSSSRTASTRA